MTTETKELTKAEEQALARQGQEDAMVESLTKLLPQHIDTKRFIALALAVYRDPNLRECTNQSKMLALADCAKLGLIPDRNLGHVWLVPFRNRFQDTDGSWKTRLEVTLIPGYQGYIELARRSRMVTAVHTGLVRADDDFTWWIDEDGPHLRHTPLSADDAEIIKVYCIAKLTSGEPQLEVMTMAQVNKMRACSKAKTGPWVDWDEEMIRKSSVRRARKYWPQSAELAQLGALDDFADGIVSRSQVDNMPASSGLAAAPTGRLNLSAPAPDPEPEPLEETPTGSTTEEPKNEKTNKKPASTKKPKKTEAKTKANKEAQLNDQAEETVGGLADIPMGAVERQTWLARRAMESTGFDDEPAAMQVVRRWLMANSIAPSQLDQNAVFNPTKDKMATIDWKALFDEFVAEAIKASKLKEAEDK